MENTVAVILGGGKGTRLFPLTRDRSKPAVPIAGKYRLVDIPISNCIHANLHKIFVLTMYQSASLNRHISNAYRFDHFSGGFVQILAAEQGSDTRQTGWFEGTADAVRKCCRHLANANPDHVLILSGDHLYRMDYAAFAACHKSAAADISIAVKPVGRDEAPELGILKIDETGRIVKFKEKPKKEEEIAEMATEPEALRKTFGLTPEQAAARPFLASMGIYYFGYKVLRDLLFADPGQMDFGKEIIPAAIGLHKVQAFRFDGYWADIGTIRSFFEANLDLVLPMPKFNLFDPVRPIYTRNRFLPGAKLNSASVGGSVLCDGVIVEGATVQDSILGVRARVRRSARVEYTLVMGADFYQPAGEGPFMGIDEGAHVSGAIVDKNTSIGRYAQLVNRQGLQTYDDPEGRFHVRDGIIVVSKGSVIPEGFVF